MAISRLKTRNPGRLFPGRKILFIIMLNALAACFFSTATGETFTFCTPNSKDHRIFEISHQVLKEAFKRMGYGFELRTYPAKRCPMEADRGRVDGDAHRIYAFNAENRYPNLIRVEEPIQPVDQSVFTKNPRIKVDGWESIKPYRIIYLSGIRIIESGLDRIGVPEKNRIPVFDHTTGFRKLANDRGDLIVISSHTGRQFLKEMNLKDSDIHLLTPPLAYFDLYPFMNKKYREQARKLAQVLKEMKRDNTWQRIIQGE